MRIFATKEIECGGQKRPFKVNLFATALFCEHKGIKLSHLETTLGKPSLLDIMDLAYFAHLATGNQVERDEFMGWFDDSDLLTEFTQLITEAFQGDGERTEGKPKRSTGAK
jgi:hypothetical protein